MSEAEILTLNEGDFVILEEAVEFDEKIQREERVRFYTKTEQEQDAFEKLLPPGASTLAQRQRARREVVYYSDLYEKYIVPTDEDYILRQAKKTAEVDWIFPIYHEGDTYDPPSSSDRTLKLTVQRTAAGYYERMVKALPRPYSQGEGDVFPIENPTVFVDKEGDNPIRALPEFKMVTTLVNEDKTIEIRKKPIPNTEDSIHFQGYFLKKRPVDIPNPMPGHDFFESTDAKVILNTAPLADIFPDMDAIFTHGIPVTADPYKEGSPYLKLYDVKLSEIPWSVWKTRFPPVSLENEPREPVDIRIPKSESTTVSTNVQETYGTTHSAGLSPREWLMRQEDGGNLIVKLLLSESNQFGNVEIIPGIDLPLPDYPSTTLEECRLSDISFQDFTTRGILRRKWTIEKKDGKEVDVIKIACVPLEYVQQERSRLGYTNRILWKDDTGEKLKEKQARLLKRYTAFKEIETKREVGKRTPTKEQSERRKEILAVLHDPARDNSDKHRDVKALLADSIYSEKTYVDQAGLFVLCAHTMSLLEGDLSKNAEVFYDTWGVKEDGFYVCKVCGQRLDAVEYDTSDDFDDNDMVVRHAEVLETKQSEEVISSTSLQKIRHLLDKNSTVHLVMFLLLGLLQVEPTVDKMPIYLNMAAEAAEGIGTEGQGILLRGVIGLVATAILLQTHQPFLVPRRAFGPRPLKMSGFPRDSSDPKGENVIDSLLTAVRKTFEAYPSSISSRYESFVREIVKDSAKVRAVAVRVYTERFLKKQPTLAMTLEAAKVQVPVAEEVPSTLPTAVPVPSKLGEIKHYPVCEGSIAILRNPNLPNLRQAEVPLKTGISAARSHKEITPSPSERESVAVVPKTEISALLKLKTALNGTYLDGKIGDSVQANLAIASRLADKYNLPLPVRTIDPSQNPAELRDYARGLVYQVVKAIKDIPKYASDFNERTKADLTLMCLLANLDTEKNEVRRVSASERMSYVKGQAAKTDIQREIDTELVRIGMGPVLITMEDRDLLARREEEDIRQLEEEVGVGLVQNNAYDDGIPYQNADDGDYGNLPGRFEGRDVDLPSFADDPERGI